MNGKLLNTEEIRSRLTDEGTGCRLFYCEEVDSTNDWAKREGRKGVSGGAIYLAERQTAGKGRRGRAWNTAAGTSVSMSLLLRPDLPADRISMLTLVMGMAAADGIRRACGLDTQIKWPNDVIIGGKKALRDIDGDEFRHRLCGHRDWNECECSGISRGTCRNGHLSAAGTGKVCQPGGCDSGDP